MNFKQVDLNSPKSLPLQVTEIIEQKIINGEISVGQKLPTQRELRKIFNVSINTIEKAISNLTRASYLNSRNSYGTFVIDSSPKKSMILEKRNEIGLIIPQSKHPYFYNPIDDPYLQRIIHGIEEKVIENGAYLIYSSIRNNELYLIRKEKDIAGLIVLGATPIIYKQIKKSGFTSVLIGDVEQKKKTGQDIDVITNDDFQGAYLATKHLINLGHRKIAFLVGFLKDYSSWELEKLRGYKKAYKEAGFTYNRNLVIGAKSYSMDDGYKAVKGLLNKSISFSALIGSSGYLSTGALKVLKEKGIKIPEDISFVNFGMSQELTNVSYDTEDMGRAAVERLIKRLKDKNLKPGRITVPFKLNNNNSTKRIS